MSESFAVKVIARMHSDFPAKFGIPRQSGLVNALKSTVVFEPAYRNPDAVRGLEEFSHIWLIWQFSEAVREGWSQRSARLVWEETLVWEYLQHVLLFGPMPLGYPV